MSLLFSKCLILRLYYKDQWPLFVHFEFTKDENKKDETVQDAAGKKKVDSDSDEEEQDNLLKEKGISNKKKKVLFLFDCSMFFASSVLHLVEYSFLKIMPSFPQITCFLLNFFQLQRRMKIAELKQICRRPDVVEVW